MQFSIPYRQHPLPPFWGPPTSRENFCEEDYIITSYIAEVIATLTNFTYLYYAYYGIKSNANRQDAILRNLPYLGIASVGIGSTIFHSTLKNYTQWCDELSMHIATAFVIHRVFTFDKSLKTTVISGVAMTLFLLVFIVWHCMTDEEIGHNVLFGVMIAVVGVKTRSIIGSRVSNPDVSREVKKLVTWGGISFVGGFFLWNMDNIFCSQLTTFKRRIGMPWSFVFELHGWWHIFTGIGAYTFIALVEYLTSSEAGQPLGRRFAWPVGRIINGFAGKRDETEPLIGGSPVRGVNNFVGTNGIANGNGNSNGMANGCLGANAATNGSVVRSVSANGSARGNVNGHGYGNGKVGGNGDQK